MPKKSRFLVILVIFMHILISGKCLAAENIQVLANNIQIIDNQTSAQELINIQDNKPMLTKSWYSYQFEVNMDKVTENGEVYPVDRTEYQNALAQVAFPLDKIGNYKVYFLDYKLKNYSSALALSFLDDSAVVFGSYYRLSEEKINQLAVHELGHEIDFKLMNTEIWQRYIEIRGLTDEAMYNNWSAIHENRPQEIFADDFRLLFGGEKAKTITHINQGLLAPDSVQGLKEFFLSLTNNNEINTI